MVQWDWDWGEGSPAGRVRKPQERRRGEHTNTASLRGGPKRLSTRVAEINTGRTKSICSIPKARRPKPGAERKCQDLTGGHWLIDTSESQGPENSNAGKATYSQEISRERASNWTRPSDS